MFYYCVWFELTSSGHNNFENKIPNLLNLFFRVLLENLHRSQPMPMCGLCPAMVLRSVPVELMRVHPYAAYPKKSRCILWWLVISLLAFTREQYYAINYESKLFFEQTYKPLFFLFVCNLEKIYLFIDYFGDISKDNLRTILWTILGTLFWTIWVTIPWTIL